MHITLSHIYKHTECTRYHFNKKPCPSKTLQLVSSNAKTLTRVKHIEYQQEKEEVQTQPELQESWIKKEVLIPHCHPTSKERKI